MDKCRHCQMVRSIRNRGLCSACYMNPEIRRMHKGKWERQPGSTDEDVTEERLNEIIAEQRRNLPKWWDRSSPPEEPLTVPFVRTKLPRRSVAGERAAAYFSRSW